jgi:hypothetical protein
MLSSLFPLTVISYIATVVAADDLFTDFTGTDLNLDSINWDAATSDSNNVLLPNDADPSGQLLAFNDNQESSPFTNLGQPPTDGLDDKSANWLLDNSMPWPDSPDINQFSTSALDDGTLDLSPGTNQASSELFDEFDPSGQLPASDLVASGVPGSCSSFRPSSPSRRHRKREDLTPSGGSQTKEQDVCANSPTQLPENFFGASSKVQAKIYSTYVCPSTDFPAALLPVCSSIVPTNNQYIPAGSSINPDSHTLFDSSLCKSFHVHSFRD